MSNKWDEYFYDWTWPKDTRSAEDLAREVLGVVPSADVKEIKRAYRALARQLHPDTDPSDKTLADRFKIVSEAFEILTTDRNKRTRTLVTAPSKEPEKTEYIPYEEWWLTRFGDPF